MNVQTQSAFLVDGHVTNKTNNLSKNIHSTYDTPLQCSCISFIMNDQFINSKLYQITSLPMKISSSETTMFGTL